MKMLPLEIKRINNTTSVAGINVNGETQAARAAYKAGAQAVADMLYDLVLAGDTKGIFELAMATRTKNFYES